MKDAPSLGQNGVPLSRLCVDQGMLVLDAGYGVAGAGTTVRANVAVWVTTPEVETNPESPVAAMVTGLEVAGALRAAVR